MTGQPGLRAIVARRLRTWADRIDHYGAPKIMSYSFTFEAHEGIRFRDDHRGCPLAYLGDDDWERAYSEADTDWTPTPSREDLLAGVADTLAPVVPADPQCHCEPEESVEPHPENCTCG